MLNHRLLSYLDEVARSGSIRRAASRLNVASSAVNRQILALEDEIGTPIFDRLPRGMRLTATGELLIRHVRDTMKSQERVLARIASLKGLQTGEVKIVTMGGIAAGLLAGIIGEFRETNPRILVKVQVLPIDAIVNAVLSGEAELALAYSIPENPRLRVIAEFQHQLGAVMAPGHPLNGRFMLRMSDCLDYPLVLADSSMTLRPLIDRLIPPGAPLNAAVETNSIELMKRLAQTPPHITFVNLSDVGEEIRRGVLAFTPLRDAHSVTQKVHLVHRARGSLDAPASLFASRIELAFEKHSSVD